MINNRRRDYHIIVCHREYQGRLINGGIINRHDIGESVLIKCSERLTVYRDAVNDGRILSFCLTVAVQHNAGIVFRDICFNGNSRQY